MLHIAFIGVLNQTNSIVSEMLHIQFDSEVEFISPVEIFSSSQIDIVEGKDLVFVDINTSKGPGNVPKKVVRLKKIFRDTPVLVMHSYEHARFTESLIKAGANGILSITPTEEELKEAVEQVIDGNTYNSFSG